MPDSPFNRNDLWATERAGELPQAMLPCKLKSPMAARLVCGRGHEAMWRNERMAVVEEFQAGGYRFLPGGFQFSGGVAASPDYEIKRCRFRAPVPLMEGFARIEAVIRSAGRPLTAFCACELRSPGQFTERGVRDF